MPLYQVIRLMLFKPSVAVETWEQQKDTLSLFFFSKFFFHTSETHENVVSVFRFFFLFVTLYYFFAYATHKQCTIHLKCVDLSRFACKMLTDFHQLLIRGKIGLSHRRVFLNALSRAVHRNFLHLQALNFFDSLHFPLKRLFLNVFNASLPPMSCTILDRARGKLEKWDVEQVRAIVWRFHFYVHLAHDTFN